MLTLGLSQLICWGVSYYLIGVFGQAMASDLGWSLARVYAGFSLALVVMGLVSARVGRLIEQRGGRFTMSIGSVLLAAGCGLLAISDDGLLYWLAWTLLGLAMRCTLYDAAFAALARLLGPQARRPISQITLLGGLASTVFWPLGQWLADGLGWRAAVAVFGVMGLATLWLHLRIPLQRWGEPAEGRSATPGGATGGAAGAVPVARSAAATPGVAPAEIGKASLGVNAWLFGAICALVGFANAAMSSQQIVLMVGLGLGTATAVWIGSLRGIAQTIARFLEILFGRRFAPLDLNLFAALTCLAAFAVGPFIDGRPGAAMAFSFLFGAGNGLLTITRGTMPLQLFDARHYGSVVGRLIAPGFYLAASAPVVLAWVIERHGAVLAAWLLLLLSTALSLTSLILRQRARRSMRQ